MEHLSLEIFDRDGTGSSYATLPEDCRITMTDTSEIFASGDTWSHSFTLNVRANAHIFGTAGDMDGSRLHEQLDKRRARLWVSGLALLMGYLRLADEADVDQDGNVDVTLEGGNKTFSDMIEGAKANQVPLMGDVLIGMALWRKRWSSVTTNLAIAPLSSLVKSTWWSPVFYQIQPHDGTKGRDIPFTADGENDEQSVQEYPRMVFPRLPDGTFESVDGGDVPHIDCINTDYAYDDAHPYCNVALCYQKYGYVKKDKDGNTTVDYGGEPEAQRGYEYMPADRINSAPNFYVIYWIRALMKHLGIYIEENQMMEVEDLRRLFFVNTDCAYSMPDKLRTVATDPRYGKFRFTKEGRHIRRLVPEYFGAETKEEHSLGTWYTYERQQNVSMEDSGFEVTDYIIKNDDGKIVKGVKLKLMVAAVTKWSEQDRERYEQNNGYLHLAYATSDCFPAVDISEVIKAVEGGFGVRFLFSDDYKRVRIVLLRSVFRNHDIQDVACEVTGERKTENAIRGFRMTYGESTDTHFYYKGFADKLPHQKTLWPDDSDKHDYSHWNLTAAYQSVIKKVSAFDKTCYVTPDNGNAYIIKVDKNAKRYRDLHPSLFEGAGFMDAEGGDCTGDESTIGTVNAGFTPAIVNDLNMEEERKGDPTQRVAIFVDDQMKPRRPDLSEEDSPTKGLYYPIYGKGGLYGEDSPASVMKGEDGIVKPGEFFITSDMYAQMTGKQLKARIEFPLGIISPWNVTFDIDGQISEGYRLYLEDNYEPNDSGVSPVESHDWGLTLGIMRGSGGDARIDYEPDPDDGEGNDTWDLVAGSSVTAHPDTCDNYGSEWDYNGQQEGIGPEGRVSLKLRAEKPNPYFDPSQPEGDDNRRYLEIGKESLRGRGLADQFYKDYSYWVRNARIAHMTVRMELADLLRIDKTKRVRVGAVTGFIRKLQYSVGNRDGLGLVDMEILYI